MTTPLNVMKRARKKCLFPSKKRKELVASVVRDKHDEIIDKSIEKLLTQLQFKYYSERLKCLQDFDQQLLLQCARNMVLQNSWFLHINLYFDASIKVDGVSST